MDTSSTNKWQELHSAEKSHWEDLGRGGGIIIPVLLLILLAMMSAIGYEYLYSARWANRATTNAELYWVTIRIYLTFLAPLFVSAAGIILLFRVVIHYAKTIYGRPDEKKILALVQRRLLGVPPLPPPISKLLKYPFVTIKEPKDLKEDHWVRWLGGPATLVIYDGTALYLERGNRFSRVVGPGKPPMPFLDRYETVKAIVDLRPQVKEGETRPWTKDGIQIDVKIRMECQIDASEEARLATHNLVYPFDPMAVKHAVEYTAVKFDRAKNELNESDWLDGVWGQVTGHINRHISSHSIDEIALSEIEDLGQSKGNLQTFKLAQKHLNEINANLAARPTGAKVLSIQIAIAFPEEVEEYRVKHWEAERNKVSAMRLSKAEADGIRVREEARARAERDMLNAITEKLKDVNPDNLTEPLLMSLTGILENSLEDPLIRPIIAKNSLALLEQLRKTLKDRF